MQKKSFEQRFHPLGVQTVIASLETQVIHITTTCLTYMNGSSPVFFSRKLDKS